MKKFEESAVNAILDEFIALLFDQFQERLKDEPEDTPFTDEQRDLILNQFIGISADLFVEYTLQDLIRSSKNRNSKNRR